MSQGTTGRPADGAWHPARRPLLIIALVVSAYLMALAIDSASHWWLGWVTLIPLFVAIRVFAPLPAFRCGALWGGSLFLFLFVRSAAPFAPNVGSFLLLTLIPAIYAYVGARLTRRVGFSPLLLGLGWIGVELAFHPLGLRHGLLAGTQGDGAVVRLVGSFAGYALVAFLVAYINASLLSVLSRVRRGLSGGRFVAGSKSSARPFYPDDALHYLFHFLRPAQPRAPPR